MSEDSDVSATSMSGISSLRPEDIMHYPDLSNIQDKKMRRLVKNRIAAKVCRNKKKQYVESLESEVLLLQQTIQHLRDEVSSLSYENEQLLAQLGSDRPRDQSKSAAVATAASTDTSAKGKGDQPNGPPGAVSYPTPQRVGGSMQQLATIPHIKQQQPPQPPLRPLRPQPLSSAAAPMAAPIAIPSRDGNRARGTESLSSSQGSFTSTAVNGHSAYSPSRSTTHSPSPTPSTVLPPLIPPPSVPPPPTSTTPTIRIVYPAPQAPASDRRIDAGKIHHLMNATNVDDDDDDDDDEDMQDAPGALRSGLDALLEAAMLGPASK
ncbi:hypothetical protein RI367_001022 [Sorochytrium milnesiophthora]